MFHKRKLLTSKKFEVYQIPNVFKFSNPVGPFLMIPISSSYFT